MTKSMNESPKRRLILKKRGKTEQDKRNNI